MTKSESKRGMPLGQALFCAVSITVMMLTFLYSEVAISAMSVGMRLCVNTVIPSLFPFMVCSELLISSGAGELLGRIFGRPLAWLFDISREGAVALLLGFLCGFPIGIRSVVSLYEKGRISRGELEHISTFCNNPSSAFLVSAVGAGLFGSSRFGALLYASHIISSCVVGLVGRYYFASRKRGYSASRSGEGERRGVVSSVIKSVTDSAGSMLFICAFVVFFSAVVGFLRVFAESSGVPDGATALMLGFFEMTGGAAAAAELPLRIAIPAVAAITGWSGLSVHFQLVSVCREHRFSLWPYFISKIACSLLNAGLICAFVGLAGDSLSFGGGDVSSVLLAPEGALFALLLFGAGCVRLAVGRKRK